VQNLHGVGVLRSLPFEVCRCAFIVVGTAKTICAKSIQVQDQLVCQGGCGQILMLVSGKGGGPRMLAGNALLHKMGAVTPNRKLVVSPGKLHFVKTGTTHVGGKLGLRTFVDHDAALTVVVVVALTNILGEIPYQLGGKTHASLYKTPRTLYAGFS
jgi:hypothetical protein